MPRRLAEKDRVRARPRTAGTHAHRPRHDRAEVSRGARWLDAVGWAVLILGLLLALKLDGSYGRWPLLGLLIPGLRLLVSRAYRKRCRIRMQSAWQHLEAFSAGQGPTPWREAALLVGGPFLLFNLSHGAILGAVDTQPVAPTAVSLVREGNVELSEYLDMKPWSPLRNRRDGALSGAFQRVGAGEQRIVSAFPPGMVPWATAVAAGAELMGADLSQPRQLLRLEKLTAALVASAVLTLFALAACQLGSPAAGLLTTGFLATGSAVLTTVGLGLWQHGGVAFWLLIALLIELKAHNRATRMPWPYVVIQGLALGQMLACRPTAALLVGLFGLWVLAREPRRALALGAVAALAYAPWVLFYAVVYQTPFGPQTMVMNAGEKYWSFFQADRLLGVLGSPARGLFVYQVWAVLAVVGLLWSSPRAPRGWRLFASVAVTAHVVVIAAWHDWSGGWCWGSRLLTEVIPILGLLAVPVVGGLAQRRAGRGVLATLAMAGVLVHGPCWWSNAGQWNATHNHQGDLWSWSKAPFLHDVRR